MLFLIWGGVFIITYSLGDLPADTVGDPLMLMFALLHWLLGALLPNVVGADLIRDLTTLLGGDIDTLLLLHFPVLLPLPRLLNVHAFLVGVGLAGAGDDDPLLALLPLLGACLLVHSSALSFSVCFIHVLAHLIPHRFAFPLINYLTHFFGNRSALFLGRHLALRHPLGDALRGLDVLVLGLIHGGVLGPALHPMMAAAMVRFARSSGSQAQTSGD